MKRIIFYIFLIFSTQQCLASEYRVPQNKLLKLFNEATGYFQHKDYEKALKLTSEILTRKPDYMEAHLLKAEIYHDLDSVTQQIECLKTALAIDSIKYPKIYYQLAEARFKCGDYREAQSEYRKFIEKAGNLPSMVAKARDKIKRSATAVALMEKPVVFDPVNLGDSINSEFDDYWPSITIDKQLLVFTRLVPFTDSITRQSFPQEDFFISEFNGTNWTLAKPMRSVNSFQNEGAQSISPDGSLLFFTACSRRDTWGGCDLYFSQKESGKWSPPRNVGSPVNSPSWESQPSISADNKTLYFVSNRKGGKGGMDIWKCRLTSISEGTLHWGKPENLGDSINTPGNEMSPYIHPDSQTLYFSSDYWPGMGGNDIFYSRLNNDSVWSQPVNIGYPINTTANEQGLIVDAAGETAYYSSNKKNKNLDIYSFPLPEPTRPHPVSYLQGKVYNAKTGELLDADIELADLQDCPKKLQTKSVGGAFLMAIPMGRKYMFNVSKPGYLFYSEHFCLNEIKDATQPFLLDIALNPIEAGSVTVLKNVFYETGLFSLLPESQLELQKLVDFLNLNPDLKIEIGGHTDPVGSEKYNLELSEKRAKEVYQFLAGKGISETRLKAKGYGFSDPISTNETEEGRAANRRTEFKILK